MAEAEQGSPPPPAFDTAPPRLTASEAAALRWALGGMEPTGQEASADLVADLLDRLEGQAQTLVPGWQRDREAKAFARAAMGAARKVRALHAPCPAANGEAL